MISSKSSARIAFLSRQLARLSERDSASIALAKLQDACPPQYSAELRYLMQMFDETSPVDGPYRILGGFMRKMPNARTELFRGFVEYAQQNNVVFGAYWSGIVNLVGHLASLAAVMVIVSLVFWFATIPAFEEMYRQFGADLPEITALVFRFGDTGLPLFVLVVGAAILLALYFVLTFNKRLQDLEPLPNWPTWLPLIGSISRFYNVGLMLNFSRILNDAGMETDAAVELASAEANIIGTTTTSEDTAATILTQINVARKVNQLQNEISYLCDEHISTLSLELSALRDRFSLIIKSIVYTFIALMVVAMYLPIFKLGSIV